MRRPRHDLLLSALIAPISLAVGSLVAIVSDSGIAGAAVGGALAFVLFVQVNRRAAARRR